MARKVAKQSPIIIETKSNAWIELESHESLFLMVKMASGVNREHLCPTMMTTSRNKAAIIQLIARPRHTAFVYSDIGNLIFWHPRCSWERSEQGIHWLARVTLSRAQVKSSWRSRVFLKSDCGLMSGQLVNQRLVVFGGIQMFSLLLLAKKCKRIPTAKL